MNANSQYNGSRLTAHGSRLTAHGHNYALITDDNNGSVPSRKGQGFFVVRENCGVMSWA